MAVSSLSCRGNNRLHSALHDVMADLISHSSADARRKSVMESGPDAGVRDLFGQDTEVGPAVGDARRGQAGQRHLWNVRGTEHGLYDRGSGAALDTVRARILRMQW